MNISKNIRKSRQGRSSRWKSFGCGTMLYFATVLGAFAQTCESHEHDATKCVRRTTQYGIKRIYPFSETKGTVYEFANECTENLRIVATFNSGQKTLSVRMSAKKAEDSDEAPSKSLGRIVCDSDNCGNLERFVACSLRIVQPPPPPSPLLPRPPRITAPNESTIVPTPSPVVTPAVQPTVIPPPPAPVIPPPPPKPRFVIRQNWDLVGIDLKSLNGIGADECREACSMESTCMGYTADRWNRLCFLKSSAINIRLEPKATSGWKEGLNPSSSAAARVIELYRKRRFTGSQVDTRIAETVILCQSACLNTEQCVGFSFFSNSHQCVRFSQVDNYSADDNVQSGIKRQPEPTSR
jgi:hypothetical protein